MEHLEKMALYTQKVRDNGRVQIFNIPNTNEYLRIEQAMPTVEGVNTETRYTLIFRTINSHLSFFLNS